MNKVDSSSVRGIQLMLVGVFILPLMDAASKMMGDSIATGVTVLARFSFQTLFLLPFVWSSLVWPSRQTLLLHFWRSLSICFATICFFTAIQVMPIADSLAIFFVMPLMVTLLAPWVLHESVGWHRVAAVAVGLLGATIIIQPGYEAFGLRTAHPKTGEESQRKRPDSTEYAVLRWHHKHPDHGDRFIADAIIGDRGIST